MLAFEDLSKSSDLRLGILAHLRRRHSLSVARGLGRVKHVSGWAESQRKHLSWVIGIGRVSSESRARLQR